MKHRPFFGQILPRGQAVFPVLARRPFLHVIRLLPLTMLRRLCKSPVNRSKGAPPSLPCRLALPARLLAGGLDPLSQPEAFGVLLSLFGDLHQPRRVLVEVAKERQKDAEGL